MEADIAAITLCPSFESKFESKIAAPRRAIEYASCGEHEFAQAQHSSHPVAEFLAATA
jgi:hypothetical protein